MKLTFNPYLIFSGDCAKAMKFYQSIFGGDLEMSSFGDAPTPSTESIKDQIVHAKLTADDIIIMASDPGDQENPLYGNNVHLSVGGSDEAVLTKYYNQLAEGGRVDLPLAKQFWGDHFGMVTDKFDVHWMINITPVSHQA